MRDNTTRRSGRRSTRRRRGVRWLACLALAGCLAAAGVGIAVAAGNPPPGRPGRLGGWRVRWSASFAGPAGAGVNRRWRYDTGQGRFGNGEIETMTSARANVQLDGHGDLNITALGQGAAWTSGRIQTTRYFAAPPGGEMQVTALLRQPDPAVGAGYWPAFWLLGRGAWPEHGEIDILEDVDGLSDHSGALHCGNLTQVNAGGTYGPCHEHTGISSGLRPCPGCQAGYHRYSVIVDRRNPAAETITWYLDGRTFFTVRESQVPAAVWDEAVNNGFTIILDLALGGSFPDTYCRCDSPTAQTTAAGTMSVAAVQVLDRFRSGHGRS